MWDEGGADVDCETGLVAIWFDLFDDRGIEESVVDARGDVAISLGDRWCYWTLCFCLENESVWILHDWLRHHEQRVYPLSWRFGEGLRLGDTSVACHMVLVQLAETLIQCSHLHSMKALSLAGFETHECVREPVRNLP